MNLILGFISLVKEPRKHKFLGFVIPVLVMALPFVYQDISKKHPLTTFLIFWLSIPVYIYFLGYRYKNKSNKNKSKIENVAPVVANNYTNENYFPVSHIEERTEEKTVKTNTKTKTIYFNNGGYVKYE